MRTSIIIWLVWIGAWLETYTKIQLPLPNGIKLLFLLFIAIAMIQDIQQILKSDP